MPPVIETQVRPGTDHPTRAIHQRVADAPAMPTAPTGYRGDLLVLNRQPQERSLLTRYLDQFGYQVRTTGSVAEAFDLVCERPPDLILMACESQDPACTWFLDQLNADAQLAPIPVLLLASTCFWVSGPNKYGGGVVGHLFTPLRLRTLEMQIDATLQAMVIWNPVRNLSPSIVEQTAHVDSVFFPRPCPVEAEQYPGPRARGPPEIVPTEPTVMGERSPPRRRSYRIEPL
jgi:CheY-like chemotaxis protein